MGAHAFALAVHGGAGGLLGREVAREARRALTEALTRGGGVLADAGAALDAVVEAVRVLEDAEVLNAGRGSALCAEGHVEMDAALMEGASRGAGAVAGLRRVRNPIAAARAVLERSDHVLLAGAGAEAFARACGLALEAPEHFVTERRRDELARASAGRRRAQPGATVGAVARDRAGHLAAATSTGGTTGKLPGRVSDSCLLGSGTWADDATCAVSATGHGESFVRSAFAHEVDALLRHAGLDLASACRRALARVAELGQSGGCIAIDASGRCAFAFTTPAMSRGRIGPDGVARVAVEPGDAEI